MQENIEVIRLIFTPGRTIIIIIGFLPMLYGFYRMLTEGGEPGEHQRSKGIFTLGGLFVCVVFASVVIFAVFTQ